MGRHICEKIDGYAWGLGWVRTFSSSCDSGCLTAFQTILLHHSPTFLQNIEKINRQIHHTLTFFKRLQVYSHSFHFHCHWMFPHLSKKTKYTYHDDERGFPIALKLKTDSGSPTIEYREVCLSPLWSFQTQSQSFGCRPQHPLGGGVTLVVVAALIQHPRNGKVWMARCLLWKPHVSECWLQRSRNKVQAYSLHHPRSQDVKIVQMSELISATLWRMCWTSLMAMWTVAIVMRPW